MLTEVIPLLRQMVMNGGGVRARERDVGRQRMGKSFACSRFTASHYGNV